MVKLARSTFAVVLFTKYRYFQDCVLRFLLILSSEMLL